MIHMKYVLTLILVSCCLLAISQEDVLLGIYKPTNRHILNANQQEALESKIMAWATKNGYATMDNNAPVGIKPSIVIHESKTVSAGMRNVMTTAGDLILTAQSADGKIVFGTFSKSLSGSGKTQSAAKSAMLRQISRKDEDAIAFFEEVKAKIVTYYKENCQVLLAESDRQQAVGNLNQAVKILGSIPIESSCAGETSAKLAEAYNRSRDQICAYNLTQAKAAGAANEFEKALTFLRKIDPEASCYTEVEQYVNTLKTEVDKNYLEEMNTLRTYFASLANQQNWQLLLLNDYLNR